MACQTLTPEAGQIYRCSDTPSGFILVTMVGHWAAYTGGYVKGWGDATGHTASHHVVVGWDRLRNTKRRGPFSAVTQTRTVRPSEEGAVDPTEGRA